MERRKILEDISIKELVEPIVLKNVIKILEPLVSVTKEESMIITTKKAKEITGQSTNGWQEIANLPEVKAIQHPKKRKNGRAGISIYYFSSDFKRVIPKVLREKVFD